MKNKIEEFEQGGDNKLLEEFRNANRERREKIIKDLGGFSNLSEDFKKILSSNSEQQKLKQQEDSILQKIKKAIKSRDINDYGQFDIWLDELKEQGHVLSSETKKAYEDLREIFREAEQDDEYPNK